MFLGRSGRRVGTGAQPNQGVTVGTDISSTGRFVVFTSAANNLVSNDTNNAADVFLRDNQAGTTERVSVGPAGVQAGLGGYGGLVSADGRYVAFSSDSVNLVADDTNGTTDVFVRDRQDAITTRVSVKAAAGQADGPSYLSAMTPDAKFVVFASDAENLIGTVAVPLDENFSTDIYLRNRATSVTTRISIGTDGSEGDSDSSIASISDNGRFIAFASNASNFDVNDSGSYSDIFLRDRTLATTTLLTGVSGAEADGESLNVAISGDGSTVILDSDASNLVPTRDLNFQTDVYAVSVATGTRERISVASNGGESDDFSLLAGVSTNGRYVVFQSAATNLLVTESSGLANSFIRDRATGATRLAGNTQQQAEPSNPDGFGGSSPNGISGDGRYVLFSSNATDVMSAGDSNGTVADVFLRSNPVPFIFLASPSTVTRGTTVTISFTGTDLHAGSLVVIGGGVTVNSVTFVDQSKINVNVTVAANADLGPRTPYVFDAGTGAGAFTGGLTYFPSLFSVV